MADVKQIDLYAYTRHIERLFVLGAGFSSSVSSQFPLTRDLLECLFDEDPDLPGKWASLASLFAPFLRARESLDVPEITSVLTVLEAYRGVVGKKGKADAQIRELQTRVLYAASTFLYRISLNAANSPVLKEFVSKLDPEKDAIVTLNWDVALEKALANASIDFQYDVLPAIVGLDRPENLLLLKPQGSVIWSRINPISNFSLPVLMVAPAPPSPYWVLSQRLGPPPTFSNPGTPASDPAIIPPTFIGEDRARELDWSGYLLKIATYAAIQAKKVVVIGYSLPPDDFHILSVLSFGIPQDSWNEGIEVFVVDPSPHTFQKWRNAFHGIAFLTGKPVSVRHWAPTLSEALHRQGGPWP